MAKRRDLGSLFVELRLNSAQFSKELAAARSSMAQFGKASIDVRRELRGFRAGLALVSAGLANFSSEWANLLIRVGSFASLLSVVVPGIGTLKAVLAGIGVVIAGLGFDKLSEEIKKSKFELDLFSDAMSDVIAKGLGLEPGADSALEKRTRALDQMPAALKETRESLIEQLRLIEGTLSDETKAIHDFVKKMAQKGFAIGQLGDLIDIIHRQFDAKKLNEISKALEQLSLSAGIIKPSALIDDPALRAIAEASESLDELNKSPSRKSKGTPFGELQSLFRFGGPNTSFRVQNVQDDQLNTQKKQLAVQEVIRDLIQRLFNMGQSVPGYLLSGSQQGLP